MATYRLLKQHDIPSVEKGQKLRLEFGIFTEGREVTETQLAVKMIGPVTLLGATFDHETRVVFTNLQLEAWNPPMEKVRDDYFNLPPDDSLLREVTEEIAGKMTIGKRHGKQDPEGRSFVRIRDDELKRDREVVFDRDGLGMLNIMVRDMCRW